MNVQRISALLAFTALLSIGSSGCALFKIAGASVGNENPIEEKSENYRVMDLSRMNPDWMKLESGNSDPTRTDISDLAWQSRKTASIISLNSACRKGSENEPEDLRKLSNNLFLGISDVSYQNQHTLAIQGATALETTLQGKLNGEDDMMLRTVVLKRGACVYDMVYMARPRHFPDQERDFTQFVDSLRFR